MLKKMLNGPNIHAPRCGRRGTLLARIAHPWGLGPPEFSVCQDWVYPLVKLCANGGHVQRVRTKPSMCDPQKRGPGLEASWGTVPLRLGGCTTCTGPKRSL